MYAVEKKKVYAREKKLREEIQKDLKKNQEQTENIHTFICNLAGIIDHILHYCVNYLKLNPTCVHNSTNLIPTLKTCRKIIIDPKNLEMVPDNKEIDRYLFHELDDGSYAAWLNSVLKS